MGQVSEPVERVVPISLSRKAGQLYHLLMAYKGPYATRPQRLQMASLYARFLDQHRQCIRQAAAGEGWDVITIVPSSGGRQGPHPLEVVVKIAAGVLGLDYATLLAKGPVDIGHNRADDDGVLGLDAAEGRHVPLIDDTFTIGGRVQSAASARHLAGAHVTATVVAARIIDPEYNEASRDLWERSGGEPFSFDDCCLE